MELIKDLRENKFGKIEGKVYFGYIGDYIDLRFKKEIPMEYVEKTAEKLNEISEETMEQLFNFSIKYCRWNLDEWKHLKRKIRLDLIKKPSDIMKHMSIEGLIVNLPEDMSQIGINLEGSCKWEEEDGIQWLIKDDKVIYTGPWCDINIWRCKRRLEDDFNFAGENCEE